MTLAQVTSDVKELFHEPFHLTRAARNKRPKETVNSDRCTAVMRIQVMGSIATQILREAVHFVPDLFDPGARCGTLRADTAASMEWHTPAKALIAVKKGVASGLAARHDLTLSFPGNMT